MISIPNFEWYNENWCDPPGKLHPNLTNWPKTAKLMRLIALTVYTYNSAYIYNLYGQYGSHMPPQLFLHICANVRKIWFCVNKILQTYNIICL